MAASSFAWTYTTLIAALQAFLEETGTDYTTTNIDICIGLGEIGLLRDLDLDIFDATATGTFTTGNQQITKPTGFIADRTLSYVASGTTVVMVPKSREWLLDYWPTVANQTATPKYYADLNTTTWIVAGTPSTAHTWTSYHVKRPDKLSSDTATNWLGTNVPDALFHACLVYSEEFLRNDEMMALWKSEYQAKLAQARYETRKHRRKDFAPLVAAPTPSQER